MDKFKWTMRTNSMRVTWKEVSSEVLWTGLRLSPGLTMAAGAHLKCDFKQRVIIILMRKKAKEKGKKMWTRMWSGNKQYIYKTYRSNCSLWGTEFISCPWRTSWWKTPVWGNMSIFPIYKTKHSKVTSYSNFDGQLSFPYLSYEYIDVKWSQLKWVIL